MFDVALKYSGDKSGAPPEFTVSASVKSADEAAKLINAVVAISNAIFDEQIVTGENEDPAHFTTELPEMRPSPRKQAPEANGSRQRAAA